MGFFIESLVLIQSNKKFFGVMFFLSLLKQSNPPGVSERIVSVSICYLVNSVIVEVPGNRNSFFLICHNKVVVVLSVEAINFFAFEICYVFPFYLRDDVILNSTSEQYILLFPIRFTEL